jgi:RNA ligase (TIGR02306 family)
MKLASIELISEINPHPNADKLDLAKVLGYTCIVEKGKYKAGDAIVLIQPDTVLPDEPWAEMFKKRGNRTKALKLRGIWSFGIVMSPYDVLDAFFFADQFGNFKDNIGKEVSDLIGVTKYEVPMPQTLDAKCPLMYGLARTDEERWQNIADLPYGEVCDITLKIDGQSGTFYCRKDPETNEWQTGVCSRSLELKKECSNNYTRAEAKYNILEKLQAYCESNNVSLALRGEVYGSGIQHHGVNPHSKLPLSFAAYSIFNLDTLEYENRSSKHYYQNVCRIIDVPEVDLLETATLTPELIKEYAEVMTEVNGRAFEGVVIKHKNGSFKVINLNYDERK